MRQATPVIFETTPEGCFIPVSHKLNHDGYFRKTWGTIATGTRVVEMFHRFIWRATNGPIPDGFEIDHKCKNRACSNVLHMQCIPRDQHLRETNETRYASREEDAKRLYTKYPMTGTTLAQHFEVSVSAACKWIRKWKGDVWADTH